MFSTVVFMRSGRRFGLSAAQKLEVWSRWEAGQTLHPRKTMPLDQTFQDPSKICVFITSQSGSELHFDQDLWKTLTLR